jgi:hypothetical protein
MRRFGDLLSVTRCSDKTGFGLDIVTYGPDGRPQTVGVDSKGLPGGCVVASNVLGRLTLGDEAKRMLPENRETIVLMPRPDIVACADAFDPASSELPTPPSESGEIQEPRKTHDVRPLYPKNAQSDRVQGTVVVRATIGVSRCVRDLSILRSVYLSLDFEALRAVLQ